MNFNPMAILYFCVGGYLLMIGMGVIIKKYKSEEEEKVSKNRNKILGLIILGVGLVRMFLP